MINRLYYIFNFTLIYYINFINKIKMGTCLTKN